MAPIRTAIIGLSSSATTGWAAGAHLPYLLSAEGKAKFQIVALLNSSVDAAKKAIATYGLPAETRAYGDPAALAADSEVEFVVNSTRVDNHYATVLPSVKAGKGAYVEWPLAHNLERVSELAAAARESGARTIVGLQGWYAPAVVKLKELVESGRIGKVLSSEVRGAGGTLSRDVVPAGMKYFTDSKVGGNAYTIGFGHTFDYVQFVLGDIHDSKSHLQIQRPDLKIRDPSSGNIIETVESDVPDLIYLTGSLQESKHVSPGATLHFSYRRGPGFKGEPPLVWRISGEKGDLSLVGHGGPGIQAGAHGQPIDIQVHDFATDEVHKEDWSWQGREELNVPARIVGAAYEAYASGDEASYPSFEHALKRHTQLDEVLTKFRAESSL